MPAPTIETLRKDYPLRGRYPFWGEHYLLITHTWNEQHRVSVAKTEAKVLQMWSAAFNNRRYDDIKATEFWHGNIVDPPQELCDLYALERYKYAKMDFFYRFRCVLNDVSKAKKVLPAGLSLCTEYVMEDGPGNELDSDTHYDCLNCNSGLVVEDPDLLFQKKFHILFRDQWNRMEADRKAAALRPVTPCPADPNEILLLVTSSSGSDGVRIVGAPKNEDGTYCRPRDPLFYFQGRSLLVPDKCLQDVILRKKLQDTRRKDDDKIVRQKKKDHRKESERLLKLILNTQD